MYHYDSYDDFPTINATLIVTFVFAIVPSSTSIASTARITIITTITAISFSLELP